MFFPQGLVCGCTACRVPSAPARVIQLHLHNRQLQSVRRPPEGLHHIHPLSFSKVHGLFSSISSSPLMFSANAIQPRHCCLVWDNLLPSILKNSSEAFDLKDVNPFFCIGDIQVSYPSNDMDNIRLLNKDTLIILLISEAFHMLASPPHPSKDAPATTTIFLMHVTCAFVVYLFNPLFPYT